MENTDRNQPGRLRGRRVLVTGAGTGIGREIAREFAREGADVVFHYSHDSAGAEEAAGQAQSLGRRAAAVRADFTRLEEVLDLASRTVEFLGGLDVLVNNAGITMNRPFEAVTPEEFDTLYAVNVRSPFFLTQSLAPALIASRGAVINIASIHALEGLPDHSVYAGTKGAIVATTRELAVELAPKGVRVNAIAPGLIFVESYLAADPGFDPDAAGRDIPCGSIGQPADIARAAIFLASEDSRFILGQTLVVDGGTSSWMPFSEAFRDRDPAQHGKGYVPGL